MRNPGLVVVLLLSGALQAQAAHPLRHAGRLVGVSIEVDGRRSPLYVDARDAGRVYFEARYGSSYAIRLSNRTGERLGVELSVDGLNVISGSLLTAEAHRRGRMYVLQPWQTTVVRGWRTSLESVQRFSFVDESRSYAVRSGQPNERIGSIDLAVFRERRARGWVAAPQADREDAAERSSPRAAAPESADATLEAKSRAEAGHGESGFPGTGWGPRVDDRAVVVRFEPMLEPAETLVLRYEERWALVRLGLLPRNADLPERLREREGRDEGFARPPRHD